MNIWGSAGTDCRKGYRGVDSRTVMEPPLLKNSDNAANTRLKTADVWVRPVTAADVAQARLFDDILRAEVGELEAVADLLRPAGRVCAIGSATIGHRRRWCGCVRVSRKRTVCSPRCAIDSHDGVRARPFESPRLWVSGVAETGRSAELDAVDLVSWQS